MEPITHTKTGNVRWSILALLFFATTINYIDRQVIGILKPFIAEDLGWSEADYGFIVTAFQIAYAAGLLISGRFLDKYGTRVGYLIAVIVWSIAATAHALARGVMSFMGVRFLLGLGESANFPAAVKSVAEWFPKKERALATGIFNSGSTVGAILAPIIVSGITVLFGWRLAFVLTGLLGFIWIVFWLIYYRHPAGHKKLSPAEFEYIHQDKDETQSEKGVSWFSLLKHKQTLAICLTRFISDWVWWFFLFWIPDFLAKTTGVNIKELVLPLIIIYAVSSVGGIAGGWFSSHLIKSGRSIDSSRKLAIFCSALLAIPIVFVAQLNELWLIVLLISLATAGHQSWAANMFTIISDIYPKGAVGSMTGLSGLMGAIGGALSATFVGLVLQISHSYTLIFSIASVVYLLNWAIIKLLIRKIEPLKIQSNLPDAEKPK